MIPSFTSVMSTIAGKVAVGLVVATTSVGAAAAAGGEVPFITASDEPAAETEELPEQVSEQSETEESAAGAPSAALVLVEQVEAEDDDGEHPDNHGAVVSGFVHETELEGCEKGQATAAVARGLLDPESATFEDDLAARLDELGKCTGDDDDTVEPEDGDELNHGAVVSGFVHDTELEGCEKGQATAAVARGDIQPGADGTIDAAEVDDHLAGLDKCQQGDAESDGDDVSAESADQADDDDDEDRDGKGAKPDHAGQRGAERSQGKAKGPQK